jgi:hypothetical protein
MTASSTLDISDLRYSGRLAALLLDVRPGSKIVVHFLQVFLAMLPEMRVHSFLDLVSHYVLARVLYGGRDQRHVRRIVQS